MKVCKKIIGSIIILFFIMSIISLFYNYYIVQNRMSFIAENLTGEEMHNVIYNIFFAMCIQGIYSTYEVPITFGMAYIESFKSTWIIYTILFIGVFVIKYLYNKHKTNTLNKLCNKKKKEE